MPCLVWTEGQEFKSGFKSELTSISFDEMDYSEIL